MAAIRAARLASSVFVEEAGDIGAHDGADAERTAMSGRLGFAAFGTLRSLSTAIGCTRVALPGPSARTATTRA